MSRDVLSPASSWSTSARVGIVAMTLVVSACSGGSSTSTGTSAAPSTVPDRAAAIEVARAAVQAPTAALLDAAGDLAGLAEQWQANRTGIDLPTTARAPVRRARRAVAAARDALDRDAAPDVAAADDVVQAMADRVAAQATAMAGLRADEAATRPVDELGDEFVVRINDRGSRTPQRLAMEALVARVDELAPAVDKRLATSTCRAPVRARARALAHMRAVAEELGHLATTGQGTAFDALRAEATGDPFDAGTTDLETVASSTNCPEVAVVMDTPQHLAPSIEDLEAALNPSDLVAD